MGFEKELEKTIQDLLKTTPFYVEEIKISTQEGDSNIWCSITSSDSSHLIGKDGEALIALNFILKRILEKRLRDADLPYTDFMLDINGYQKKRVDSIKSHAHMLAERARFFKSSVEAPPMTSFERRIIHDHLSGQEDLKTESAGFGKDRKVVIFYQKPSSE